jgi:hypothetical protein
MKWPVVIALALGCGGRLAANVLLDASAADGPPWNGSTDDATADGGVDASLDTQPACDGSICGTHCVDLQTDALNCGRCGFDCSGGTCSNGVCTLAPPFPPSANIWEYRLAVFGSYLWVNSSTLYRIPIDGGTFEQVATGGTVADGLAVTATDLYFSVGGSIYSSSSYPTSLLADATPGYGPSPIATSPGGDLLAWIDDSMKLQTAPLPWNAAGLVTAALPVPASNVVVGAQAVYHVTGNPEDLYASALPLGSAPAKKIGALGFCFDVGVDATGTEDVVFYSGNGLQWCSQTSCPNSLADPDPTYAPGGLVVDTKQHAVYWLTRVWYPGGQILKTEYPSGTTTVFEALQSVAQRLAQDDDAIYWLEGMTAKKRAK